MQRLDVEVKMETSVKTLPNGEIHKIMIMSKEKSEEEVMGKVYDMNITDKAQII